MSAGRPELYTVADLEEELALERELERRRLAEPIRWMRFLPGQHAFLTCDAARKLFRSGVQAQGKTTAGAVEAIGRALGKHRFRAVRPPPTVQWVVCGTDRQSGIVQKRVWDLSPPDEIDPRTEYDTAKGAFTGKYPKIMYRNGSEIQFRTGGGDGLNLASGTVHAVWIDEPPENERAYNELVKRTLRTNGDVYMTLTPVNRPVAWLRDRVEKGTGLRKIEDLHFPLRVENLTFVGSDELITLEDGTPCNQTWIDELAAETSDAEIPVMLNGEWEFRIQGAYLAKVWDPDRMVSAVGPPPTLDVEALLGIDFGDRPGKQVEYLILVDENHPSGLPFVWVWDEYVAPPGRDLPEHDADGALAMLDRAGLRWMDLRSAMADRPHKAGRGDQKSAKDMQAAVAKRLKVEYGAVKPPIWVAKQGAGRGAGSVGTRSRWLHQMMARGLVRVHPRCKRLIEAAPKYSPWSDDDWKDPFDALLYGLDRYTFASRPRGARASLAIY